MRPMRTPPSPAAIACAMRGEIDRAGEAVDQRGAVEQHAGGERAEDEIFEAGFGRAHIVAVERRDHVEREAHQFEARDRARSGRPPRSASACRRSTSRISTGYSNLRRSDAGKKSSDSSRRAERADQRQELEEAARSRRRTKLPPKASTAVGRHGRRSRCRRRRAAPTGESHRRRGGAARRDRRRASAAPWRRPPAQIPAAPDRTSVKVSIASSRDLPHCAQRGGRSPRRAPGDNCRAAPRPMPAKRRAPASGRRRTGS